MKKLLILLPTLFVLLGLQTVSAENLSLEGKVTLAADSGSSPAPFVVEGTEFQMTGDALGAFVKENGTGEFIVMVDGNFDLEKNTVTVTRMTLVKKLRL